MGFFLVFFLWVGFTVIGELLRPKPKFGSPSPSALGDFSVPTAEEGRAIPVVFGTAKIAGPNVVWYGDLAVVAVKEKVKTGLFSSKKITKGYQYFLGQQLVLCHGPIDEFKELRFDDRAVPGVTENTMRPTATVPGLSTWRGNDGGTQLDTYIDEVAANDTDYIHCGAGNAASVQFVNLSSIATPVAGATHTFRIRMKKTQTTGGVVGMGIGLEIGGLSLDMNQTFGGALFNDSSPHGWQTFERVLTPAEVAQIGSYAGTRRWVFTGGGFASDADFFCSWGEFEISATIAQSGDAWDSEGKMRFRVEAPTLFGGEDREGGIVGDFDIYRGSLLQTGNDYLQAKIGALLPGYRGICYVVARQVYVGTSAYLKLISFVVRRCPNQLGAPAEHANIGGDANPACMLYEILTDTKWGLGIATGLIDSQSFLGAALTLYQESFGLSMLVDSGAAGNDLLAEILRHVDGVIYTDPQTGLIKLRLARADYSPDDLPRYDETFGVRSCRLSRPSWDETKNIVKIRYVDRGANYLERIAQAQDLASVQARSGETSAEEFPFRGISNAVAAQKVAARTLKTTTYPLAAVELEISRAAWRLRPGDVFRLTWTPLGIVDMVVRVIRIATGELRDGVIKVDAVEDIFAVSWTGYTEPAASSWVDPIGSVGALLEPRLIECPYALVVGADRLALAIAGNGSPAATGYQVFADLDGGSDYAFTQDVTGTTPTGVLLGGAGSGEVFWTDSVLRVTPGPGMISLEPPSVGAFSAGGAVLLIDDEMIAWGNVSIDPDGTYVFTGCVRGVMDTVPARHAGGSRVWFISNGVGLVSNTALVSDFTLRAKLRAQNALALESLSAVSEISVVLNSRAQRPYAPTAVKVNGASYPVLIGGALAISWSHRNRLGSWIYDDAGATASPEATTTYNLRLYDNNNVLRKTYSGLTGTSQTWTTEDTDSGLGAGVLNSRVRFELEAVVGALVSYQIIDFVVWRNIEPTQATGLEDSRKRQARARKKRLGLGSQWHTGDA